MSRLHNVFYSVWTAVLPVQQLESFWFSFLVYDKFSLAQVYGSRFIFTVFYMRQQKFLGGGRGSPRQFY